MVTTMVPTIMAVQPNQRTTTPTPSYRHLGRRRPLLLLTVLRVRQETEAEAAVEQGVQPAQARSPMIGGAAVIARIEVAALEKLRLLVLVLLVQKEPPYLNMKENSASERRKHADVSPSPLESMPSLTCNRRS
jgi:hypothetical protein